MRMQALTVASIIASALMLAACKQEARAPEPVRPVLSTILEPTASDSALAVGTVQPRYETSLGFRVLGRLIARPVNVGDVVAEGQTIAAIDATALRLAAQSAKADLSKAQAVLLNASEAEERKRILIKTDATTRQTLDDAEQALAAAQASAARARANLTKAIEQLGYAQVKADFAGVVTAVSAEVGQIVSPGQSVVTRGAAGNQRGRRRHWRGLPRTTEGRSAVHRQLAAAAGLTSARPDSRNSAASQFRNAHAPRSHLVDRSA